MTVSGTLMLVLLTLQRTASSYLLHIVGSQVKYSTTMAVLLAELVKQVICLLIGVINQFSSLKEARAVNAYIPSEKVARSALHHGSTGGNLERKRLGQSPFTIIHTRRSGLTANSFEALRNFCLRAFAGKAWQVLLPAGLFVAQNNLILYATARLQPNYFQAAWQVRLIATAAVSQWMLGTQISLKRWTYLLGIVAGVFVLCLARLFAKEAGLSNPHDTVVYEDGFLFGNVALLLACFCSAFANVALENLFSLEDTDFWVASFQMCSFSVPPALMLLLWEGFTVVDHNSNVLIGQQKEIFLCFQSSGWPWLAVLTQSAIGILGGLTTKYAGSVANGISGVATIALLQSVELIRPLTMNNLDALHQRGKTNTVLSVSGIIIIIANTRNYFASRPVTSSHFQKAYQKCDDERLPEIRVDTNFDQELLDQELLLSQGYPQVPKSHNGGIKSPGLPFSSSSMVLVSEKVRQSKSTNQPLSIANTKMD